MAFILNQNEIRFLQQFSQHEEISSISHLINALITGVDLTKKDLVFIEDYLMDKSREIEDEGLDVPQFFEAIRNIVARIVNSPTTTTEQPKDWNGQNPYETSQQDDKTNKKVKKPREAKAPSSEPKISKKEKYKESEITADNIPQYLLDINTIINQVVEARCQEEIERRIVAENKLEQFQKILRGV